MNHIQYYESNVSYARFLASIPQASYQKYIDHLYVEGGKILDVGCGVGTVVRALAVRGVDAHGIDPCKPAIEQARQGAGQFYVGESSKLPFADHSFDAVGCFTVLEHVSEPELVLKEMMRVLKPRGRIVVACPNFLRLVGLSAHHWHTRGTRQKLENLALLVRKACYARLFPRRMTFGRMLPVVQAGTFEPDDDAIIVTNAIDVAFFLKPQGRLVYRSGLLEYSGPLLDHVAELPLLRTIIGGVFLVGERNT